MPTDARHVLLVGDSIFDLHEGERRLEVLLPARLRVLDPGGIWTVRNEAHGGEYIGPPEGTPQGVSEPLFADATTGRYFDIVARNPRADSVCVIYGANDSKVYPPQGFRARLETLSDHLERDYPHARIIFTTTMYLDPAHSAGYYRDLPMSPGFRNGQSRNVYLAPYNDEIRAHVERRGYGLADLCRAVREQTERGNWDLRQRVNGGDPREDVHHVGDLAWFDDIHPNDAGTAIVADVVARALLVASSTRK